MILCLLASLLGLAIGVHYSSPNDAGKGGAVADIIALLALFSTRNYAADIYETLTKSQERAKRIIRLRKSGQSDRPIDEINGVVEKFKALELRLEVQAAEQTRANVFLAISTTVGTSTWGFGDNIYNFIVWWTH